LNQINRNVPADLDVHVIVDNSWTHKTRAIKRWLVRHPRFSLHFTPTYILWSGGSRSSPTNGCAAEPTARPNSSIRRSVHGPTPGTTNPRPFIWHKTADEILDSLATYCKRISDSGH
jgi:hypothetical protein